MCVLLVGHSHSLIKDFELFLFDWLFQSREKHPRASLVTNCSTDGILSEILRFIQRRYWSPLYTKNVRLQIQSRHGRIFLGRKRWFRTVSIPRWYRTPHSSYIRNNHVYRIIPSTLRKTFRYYSRNGKKPISVRKAHSDVTYSYQFSPYSRNSKVRMILKESFGLSFTVLSASQEAKILYVESIPHKGEDCFCFRNCCFVTSVNSTAQK